MAERPLFDPLRIRPSEPPSAPLLPPDATLSVRQVNELIRGTLANHLPPTLHVVGEIGDLSRPGSGHVYFSLKDAHSELRCVMWRAAAAKLKYELESGLSVVATGMIEVYTPRGTYQLIVRRIEPRGVGALEIAFRQLKEKLEREGLFDPRRKKPLPRFPQRVALVTSPSGAAIRDILHAFQRRFAALEVLVFPVRVQGDGAAEEIAAAIRAMNQHAGALGGIDVAIVGRGGGSLEDLWAFNTEIVARAIAASRIPIVSAVGHEIDFSISDFVADLRAATPSAAAELITPAADELRQRVARDAARAARSVAHALTVARAGLARITAYEGLARPLARVRERAQAIDERAQRLRLAAAEWFRKCRAALNAADLMVLRFASGAEFVRLGRRLEQRVYRLSGVIRDRLRRLDVHLLRQAARMQRDLLTSPRERMSERLGQIAMRLRAAVTGMLALRRQELQSRIAAVDAYSPGRVLQRGYSVTRDARTHRVIRSVAEIHPGARVATELHDGEFTSVAENPKQRRLFDS
jgi:exodeoxyribonuclease VII large subunit